MKIIISNRFDRRYKRIVKKNSGLIAKIDTIFKKLSNNPFDPSLKTHKLKGKLEDIWASSVTDDVRIIFRFIEDNEELCIYLDSIGKHDEVY